jgi:hypothetical protein
VLTYKLAQKVSVFPNICIDADLMLIGKHIFHLSSMVLNSY